MADGIGHAILQKQCRGMKRSIFEVLLGSWGGLRINWSNLTIESGRRSSRLELSEGYEDGSDEQNSKLPLLPQDNHKRASVKEIASKLQAARNILIIPGSGAIMSGKEAVKSLANIAVYLANKDPPAKKVHFGAHFLSGTMPGHVALTLGEAGIDKENCILGVDQLAVSEETLSSYAYDVCLVVGASDIINPAAVKEKKDHAASTKGAGKGPGPSHPDENHAKRKRRPLRGLTIFPVWAVPSVFVLNFDCGPSGYSKV